MSPQKRSHPATSMEGVQYYTATKQNENKKVKHEQISQEVTSAYFKCRNIIILEGCDKVADIKEHTVSLSEKYIINLLQFCFEHKKPWIARYMLSLINSELPDCVCETILDSTVEHDSTELLKIALGNKSCRLAWGRFCTDLGDDVSSCLQQTARTMLLPIEHQIKQLKF